MIKSRALEKLRSGDFVRTAVLSRVAQPWLAELIGRTGYDLIWLDMEHRDFDYAVIAPLALACRATGIDLMVRILKTGYSTPMRVLESGASGVMVPHCRSAAEARQWAEWCRFAPLGTRGFDGSGPDADYMLVDAKDYMSHANRQTFVVLQIEDRDAVDCVDEIARTEGVDVLFVGPADLTISYGVHFNLRIRTFRRPSIEWPTLRRKPASGGAFRPAPRKPFGRHSTAEREWSPVSTIMFFSFEELKTASSNFHSDAQERQIDGPKRCRYSSTSHNHCTSG